MSPDDPNYQSREGHGRRAFDHLMHLRSDVIRLLIVVNLVGLLVLAVLSVGLWRAIDSNRGFTKRATTAERESRALQARIDRATARKQLAKATQTVAFDSCKRQVRIIRSVNRGYGQFASLVERGKAQIEQYVRDGTLTEVQAQRAEAEIAREVRIILHLRLKGADCQKVKQSIPTG
jgi:hypothetical protein